MNKIKNENAGCAFLIRMGLMFSMSYVFYVIRLKCEILIIDTWNEYIKKNDRMVNLFFYLKFNLFLS